eukprot:6465485-Amphidinium_carterae.2
MTALDLCEMGEQLLEEQQFKQAQEVLEEAFRIVEPVYYSGSADNCGYGKRCDRYFSRIQAALARCQLQCASGTVVSEAVLQRMRQALPEDGLNPDAHLDFAQALVGSLGKDFCQKQENWLDGRYIEAHYHASIACALKRGNRMGGRHQGMGRGHDPPGSIPSAVKELFADLGDAGGWKR